MSQGKAPRVLLTDTDRRAYAARLAVELSRADCEVSVLCTDGHPVLKVSTLRRAFPYSGLRPLNSLQAAIDATGPDIIVPCCDRGVQHLHELHGRIRNQNHSGSQVAGLIERSLGMPESFSTVSARYDLLRVAKEQGLRVPPTRLIKTLDDLEASLSGQPFPWVLKSDGTWGGRGVRVAHTAREAEECLNAMRQPCGLGRAVKRFFVNRDPFWVRPWWDGTSPPVIMQAYVQGSPANCAVLCWQGKVLAGIAVEVIRAEGLTGPASVVRVVDNREMMLCAERIAGRLQLSGFFGLDFVINAEDGLPYLIEMNPRATPLCHLRLGKGRDMVGELWAELSGAPKIDRVPVTDNDMISYFPQAWNGSPELLQSSFQDVPWDEPELIKALIHSGTERNFLFRAVNYLHQLTHAAAPATEHKSSG